MRLSIIAAFIGILAVAPAPAGTNQALACSFESRVALDPGVGFSASQGTYAGEGFATCIGHLGGEAVEATGALSYEGQGGTSGAAEEVFGGDTCALGSGTGTVTLEIETVDGSTIVLEEDYELVRAGVLGTATGQQLLATFQFVPATDSDCIYNPITSATVYGQALFTDAAA